MNLGRIHNRLWCQSTSIGWCENMLTGSDLHQKRKNLSANQHATIKYAQNG
jgi:hypothetical protein